MAVGFSPEPEERLRFKQIQQEQAPNEIMNAATVAAEAEPPKKGTETDFFTETDLPPEMYHNIFEYCGWEELRNMLEVSKHLKTMAGNYINHQMNTHRISVQLLSNQNKIGIPPRCEFMSYIFHYVRDATVYGSNLKLFEYDEPFQNVRKITFKNLLPSSKPAEMLLDERAIKKLENLDAVEFCVHQFECKNYDRVLMHCSNNIKCLIIVTNSRTTNPSAYKCRWYFLEYPKLETIQWDQGYTNAQDKFKILLAKNPTIKNHRITRNISAAIQFIKTNKLKIDKLSLRFCSSDAPKFESICGQINDLHQNGQYKELHLIFTNRWSFNYSIHPISSLHALRSINYDGDYHKSLGKLLDLKELYINTIPKRDRIEAAKQLQQLQRLYIKEATTNTIRPFVKHSPNLTEIIVERLELSEHTMKVDELIEEREQLPDAKIQQLFLGEWAYIQLKKYSNQPKIVKIQRFESFHLDY